VNETLFAILMKHDITAS